MHELRVAQIVLMGGGVDTHNPRLSGLTLLMMAIAVGVLTGLGDCLDGNAVAARTGTVVTTGGLHDLLMTGVSGNTALNSSHLSNPP